MGEYYVHAWGHVWGMSACMNLFGLCMHTWGYTWTIYVALMCISGCVCVPVWDCVESMCVNVWVCGGYACMYTCMKLWGMYACIGLCVVYVCMHGAFKINCDKKTGDSLEKMRQAS